MIAVVTASTVTAGAAARDCTSAEVAPTLVGAYCVRELLRLNDRGRP